MIKPFGLQGTLPDDPEALIPFRERPYVVAGDDVRRNAPVHDLLYKLPAGGLLSAPEDLVHFGLADLGVGPISSSMRSQLLTSQRTADGREVGSGLGWRITRDDEDRTHWYHTGDTVGGCSALAIYPDQARVVALAGNRHGHWAEEAARAVSCTWLGSSVSHGKHMV